MNDVDCESSSQRELSSARVFLVDDHIIVRQGLRHLVEQVDFLTVAGEADEAERALSQILELTPDLVFIDAMIGGIEGIGGIELTRQLQLHDPHIHVLVTSIYDDAYYKRKAFEAGASGFIRKDDLGEKLTDAAQTILSGERYLPEDRSEGASSIRT